MAKKKKAQRNSFVLPMLLSRKAGAMKDRRKSRQGARNKKQRQWEQEAEGG